MSNEQFAKHIRASYTFKGAHALLGLGKLNGEPIQDTLVKIPMSTMNRHGLITGATGTGKTKTLQVLAESFSDAGVPVLLMDIKGDLSGLAAAGVVNDKLNERAQLMGQMYAPKAYPVELLTLSDEPGVRLRATVLEFGPILLSKILGLNDTQSGVTSMLFKYADDEEMPILDLEDFRSLLQWSINEGKATLAEKFGTISSATVGSIMRKIVELEQQGASAFFGEPSFEVEDLMRINNEGRGMISVLRVVDMQTRPKMFSTFMLQLLSELYATLPEAGDLEQPKLVLFIDEAHLIFSDASTVLIDQLETVIKLIRSKGVGIFFCTQLATDIPKPILSQLGLKIQHALRAFTANDRKAIKLASENFPESPYYKLDQLITELGTGEALVTLLNEKGIPTPVVHTMIKAPHSRMDVLDDAEIQALINKSYLVKKYEKAFDRASAKEMLQQKVQEVRAQLEQEKLEKEQQKQSKKAGSSAEGGFLDNVLGNTIVKSMMRTAGNQLVRTVLGSLGLGSKRR